MPCSWGCKDSRFVGRSILGFNSKQNSDQVAYEVGEFKGVEASERAGMNAMGLKSSNFIWTEQNLFETPEF